MATSELAARKVKATGKAFTLADFDGLFLNVSPQGSKPGRQSTLSQIERIFGNDVLPRLATMSIFEIHRADLSDVLARIESRGALSIAEKVRTWFNQLFRFALVKISGLAVNPASDLDVVALPKPPVANNPFLRLTELPALLHKLGAYGGAVTTQLGVRLLLLTGVRTGELRLATRDQLNLERGLWIISAELVKQLKNDMRKQRKRAQDIPPYAVYCAASQWFTEMYLWRTRDLYSSLQRHGACRHYRAHHAVLSRYSRHRARPSIGVQFTGLWALCGKSAGTSEPCCQPPP